MPTRRRFLLTFSALLALAATPLAFAAAPLPERIHLLVIGDTLARNVGSTLPSFAIAAHKNAHPSYAQLANASFEDHVRHLRAHEADPADPQGRPYTKRANKVVYELVNFSLREALQSEPWNIVAIQQSAADSHKPETYEPHATELIAYIKKHAPKAEIVIIQPWAHRRDHPAYAASGMTPEKMHAGLTAANRALAARHGDLRIAPVGDAFHLAQQTPLWTLPEPNPETNYPKSAHGAYTKEPANLYLDWYYKTENGRRFVQFDATHANDAGAYLAGAVLYETLFGRDVTKLNPPAPRTLTPERAASLREIAHQAVAAERARK